MTQIQQGLFGVYLSIGLKIDADTAAALAGIPAIISINTPSGGKLERSSAVLGDEVVLDLVQTRVRFKPRATDFETVGEYQYQVFFENDSMRLPSAQGTFSVLSNNLRV
jgi:hypothetical protein